jgi:hypothetical protein
MKYFPRAILDPYLFKYALSKRNTTGLILINKKDAKERQKQGN